jgi:Uma2 family endonuclease
MEAARVLPMSVVDYLAFEESSAVRHEFVAGEIHAMGGASRAHNRLSLNLATAFQAKLRGGPCEVFMNDFKVRLEVAREEFFYYPDVVVSCHPRDIEKYFLRSPTLVVEVLSPSTETIDRREKPITGRHRRSRNTSSSPRNAAKSRYSVAPRAGRARCSPARRRPWSFARSSMR